MKVVYDRHAKRRMTERGVSEAETEAVMSSPDFSEPGIKGRTTAFSFINGRYMRVTFKEESDSMTVITVTIRKKPFRE